MNLELGRRQILTKRKQSNNIKIVLILIYQQVHNNEDAVHYLEYISGSTATDSSDIGIGDLKVIAIPMYCASVHRRGVALPINSSCSRRLAPKRAMHSRHTKRRK